MNLMTHDDFTEDHKHAVFDLHHLLMSMTTESAFDKVVNAGESEGAVAWKMLTERWEPRHKSTQAGVLLGLLKWNFDGEVQGRLESFERECANYHKMSGEVLSDNLRIGIVLSNLPDNEIKNHLLMQTERLNTWSLFRGEVEQILLSLIHI